MVVLFFNSVSVSVSALHIHTTVLYHCTRLKYTGCCGPLTFLSSPCLLTDAASCTEVILTWINLVPDTYSTAASTPYTPQSNQIKHVCPTSTQIPQVVAFHTDNMIKV